jgi:hypothetical protein
VIRWAVAGRRSPSWWWRALGLLLLVAVVWPGTPPGPILPGDLGEEVSKAHAERRSVRDLQRDLEAVEQAPAPAIVTAVRPPPSREIAHTLPPEPPPDDVPLDAATPRGPPRS